MLAIAHACAVLGLEGIPIEVQVDFNPRAQTPSFTIVGLPDSAVRESRERVRAAVKNSGLQFPNKGYVVNLSPADIPKHSTAYDLAIAVGVLAATDQVPLTALAGAFFLGELSLDGRVRHVQGAMPMAHAAQQHGYTTVYAATDDAPQAALVEGVRVIPVASLGELVENLYGLREIAPVTVDLEAMRALPPPENVVDFADIKGQEHIKRALEIAVAGNHNVRMVGAPGVGKSLLARALPGILPSLTTEEALEVTRIYSVADALDGSRPLMQHRPFQNPHHTISQAGLIGGGTIPKPGAVSLSHRGVLFLDEINEFGRGTLEVMRQPIEDKQVTISRARGTVTYPSNFLLVAAHNPCPCGYYGDTTRECTCTPSMIQRYEARLSGPLLDRIDIHIRVPRVEYDKLLGADRAEPSAAVRARVQAARARQLARFAGHAGLFANGDMGAGQVQQMCVMSAEAEQVIGLATRQMRLSARAYHRVLKLARTVADLDNSDRIEVPHIAEALGYRAEGGG